jgi:hypothetical protein
MRKDAILIEDIEAVRLREGIEDVQLAVQIRRLRVGDAVNLTFLPHAEAFPGILLVVRITSIAGLVFRGKLMHAPGRSRRPELRRGRSLTFTAAQIHSISGKHHANLPLDCKGPSHARETGPLQRPRRANAGQRCSGQRLAE